ncbi:UNVERIFIED_CONTAM: guanine nucleotide-binding protein subunit alpha [Siphonaria sp. JEL0065]|nr:guanine nucleotide-binding protein subunit alpha [Siphonaria sp. JEL0065]
MEVLQIPYGFNPEDHAAAVAAAAATLERPSGAAESSHGGGAGELGIAGLTPAKLSVVARDSEMGSLQQVLGSGSARHTGMGSTGAISTNRRGTGTGSSGVLDRRDGNGNSSSSRDSGLVRPSHSSINKKMDPMAAYASKMYRELGDRKLGDVAKVAKIVEELKIGFGHLGNAEILPEAIEAIGKIWKDPGIQYCFRRANEFQLIDTYLNDLDRFFMTDYSPSDQDILNSRLMTLTISETRFFVDSTLGKLDYRVFDVGGQRSERKKWAAYFEDVSAILFVVAVSAYDQVLFLNKTDLLRQKLKNGSLISNHFSDYTLPNDFDNACEYFENKFTELNKYPDKPVYTYFTWATDREQTERILETMNSVIIELRLKDINLM